MDPLDKLIVKQIGPKNGNACNIYPCEGPHAVEEGLIEQLGTEQAYIGSTETNSKTDELGPALRKKLEVEKDILSMGLWYRSKLSCP